MCSEAKGHDAVVAVDLVGGHDGDPGQVLAVAEQEGAGDSVGDVKGVVVQESGDQCPALVGIGGGAGHPAQWRHGQGGAVVVLGSPAQEVAGGVGGGSAAEPPVDVTLAAAGQRDALPVDPVQEPGGGEQLGAGIVGRGSAGGVLLGAAAGPSQDPPGCVGLEQAAVLGVLDTAEQGAGDPGLEPGQAFVAGGDQDVPEVVGAAGGRRGLRG